MKFSLFQNDQSPVIALKGIYILLGICFVMALVQGQRIESKLKLGLACIISLYRWQFNTSTELRPLPPGDIRSDHTQSLAQVGHMVTNTSFCVKTDARISSCLGFVKSLSGTIVWGTGQGGGYDSKH